MLAVRLWDGWRLRLVDSMVWKRAAVVALGRYVLKFSHSPALLDFWLLSLVVFFVFVFFRLAAVVRYRQAHEGNG